MTLLLWSKFETYIQVAILVSPLSSLGAKNYNQNSLIPQQKTPLLCVSYILFSKKSALWKITTLVLGFFCVSCVAFFSCAMGTPISSEITPQTHKKLTPHHKAKHTKYAQEQNHTQTNGQRTRMGHCFGVFLLLFRFFGDVLFGVSWSLQQTQHKRGEKEKSKTV